MFFEKNEIQPRILKGMWPQDDISFVLLCRTNSRFAEIRRIRNGTEIKLFDIYIGKPDSEICNTLYDYLEEVCNNNFNLVKRTV